MQFATTLGWTLIHFVWQGFAVLLAYVLVMSGLRQRHPEIRYLFSVFTLLVLSALPLVTFFYLAAQSSTGTATGLQELATFAVYATSENLRSDLSTMVEPALPYAVLAWFAGVIVMMIRFSIGLVEVNRLRRTAHWDVPAEWQVSLESLLERMNLSNEIGLAMSELVQSPLVIGWLKPLILIPPSALTGLTPSQLEMILAHELEHIRRWDYLVNLWQVVVESFLFYHPAVRIISRRIRVDRENCCDDAAVRLCGNPIAYARALAHLEGLRQSNLLAVNFQIGISDSRLLDRIQRLVGRSRHVQHGSVWFTSAFMLGVLVMSSIATHYSLETYRGKTAEPGVISELVATPIIKTIPASEAMFIRTQPEPAATVANISQIQESLSYESAEVSVDLPAVTEEMLVESDVVTAISEETIAPTPTENKLSTTAPALALVPVENLAMNTSNEVIATSVEPLPQAVRSPEKSGGKLVHAVSPEFPRYARRKGISGYVKVAFIVDERGRVRNAKVVDAEPKTYFEDAALDAISQWKFDPFREDGKSISKRVVQRVDFNLDAYLAQKNTRGCNKRTGSRICRSLPQGAKKNQRVAIIKVN